jgi:hypothetical protein
MVDDFASRDLPKHRTGLHLQWLARSSWLRIAAYGLALYVAIVLLSVAIETISLWRGCPLVVGSRGNSAGFWDLLYFNFITILTIGYGEFSPIHFGRFVSACEALLGTGLFGLMISVVTAKMIAAPSNTVVFSQFAYYCRDREGFLVVFVNTTRGLLMNVDISSYFKLGGDWQVRAPIRTPFIGRSVWTFFMDRVPEGDLVARLADGDIFRCGLSGQVGGTTFSAAIQYPTDEILVIPNRDELTAFEGFLETDLASEKVARMFHYRPNGAPTLASFVSARRAGTETTSTK